MTAELCYGCKLPRETVYTHPDTYQVFCAGCARGMPLNANEWALLLLTQPGSPVGPPFAPGDVVECRRAATHYEGIGTVQEMSMDLGHGGTPLYPMFRVVITEKADEGVPDEAWYAEVSLTKVKEKGAVGD
jgi:hypothetical protein